MRRILPIVASILMLMAIVAQPTPAQAQVVFSPYWVRGYPEVGLNGCIYLVAQWSDGTYTSTPWRCPLGFVPFREGTLVLASRGYTQRVDLGCIEVVTQWLDGVYTSVPYSCPPGVVYFKNRQIVPLPYYYPYPGYHGPWVYGGQVIYLPYGPLPHGHYPHGFPPYYPVGWSGPW